MTDSVLSTLEITTEDKIIAIKETKLADSTFILSSILSNSFAKENNVCLVILHNTIGHYHNIGKRLGFDLLNQIKEGRAKTIEPLKDIVDDITSENKTILLENKQAIVQNLFLRIKSTIEELLKNNRHTTLIIDDLTHLFDLNIDLRHIITFFKYCTGLTIKNNITLAVNSHVTSKFDDILSNFLFHSADLSITVSALKTGRSRNVSGVYSVNRLQNTIDSVARQHVYHYKLFDKEIRTFAPGRALI